jgi:hypothetical protein
VLKSNKIYICHCHKFLWVLDHNILLSALDRMTDEFPRTRLDLAHSFDLINWRWRADRKIDLV